MKIAADMHCHTIASTHAFSTVIENVNQAKLKGIKAIAITDHAPAMPDSPHIWHFECLGEIPDFIDGVRVYKGAEVNILDCDGSVDLPERLLQILDFVIASFHNPTFKPKTIEEHTRAWINIANNPYIDVIGHSGGHQYAYDYEEVIPIFKEKGKLVEINAHTYMLRKQDEDNCKQIAQICKKYMVPIIVNSDAHFAYNIGEVSKPMKMLSEIGFPEELIVNLNIESLNNYLNNRKR